MTYVRIEDDMHENPKVRGVSLAARWAYLSSICRSGNKQLDGQLPKSDLGLVDATPKLAKELLEAGLWHDAKGCYEIHDYLKHNRSRAEIAEAKKRNRANGASGLAKRYSKSLSERPSDPPTSLLHHTRDSATSADLPDPPPEPSARSVAEVDSESLDESLGLIIREWERATGQTVTPMVGDKLGVWIEKAGVEWTRDAIHEMAQAGAKAMRYLDAILGRWILEGRDEPSRDDPDDAHEKRTAQFKRGADWVNAARARMEAQG